MSMNLNVAYPLPRGSAVPPPSPTCPECGNACEHDEVWPEDARPMLVVDERVVQQQSLAIGNVVGRRVIKTIRDGAETTEQIRRSANLPESLAGDAIRSLLASGLIGVSAVDGQAHYKVDREAIADLAAAISSLGAGIMP